MRQIKASCRSTGWNALLLSGQRLRGDFGASEAKQVNTYYPFGTPIHTLGINECRQ